MAGDTNGPCDTALLTKVPGQERKEGHCKGSQEIVEQNNGRDQDGNPLRDWSGGLKVDWEMNT